MPDPEVAIVVLNYNGRDLLETYLPSICDLDYDNYRVIVVDNASTDDSVPFLREHYPEITVVEKAENVGIASGYNAGAEATPEADYCWFMNNDVHSSLVRPHTSVV